VADRSCGRNRCPLRRSRKKRTPLSIMTGNLEVVLSTIPNRTISANPKKKIAPVREQWRLDNGRRRRPIAPSVKTGRFATLPKGSRSATRVVGYLTEALDAEPRTEIRTRAAIGRQRPISTENKEVGLAFHPWLPPRVLSIHARANVHHIDAKKRGDFGSLISNTPRGPWIEKNPGFQKRGGFSSFYFF